MLVILLFAGLAWLFVYIHPEFLSLVCLGWSLTIFYFFLPFSLNFLLSSAIVFLPRQSWLPLASQIRHLPGFYLGHAIFRALTGLGLSFVEEWEWLAGNALQDPLKMVLLPLCDGFSDGLYEMDFFGGLQQDRRVLTNLGSFVAFIMMVPYRLVLGVCRLIVFAVHIYIRCEDLVASVCSSLGAFVSNNAAVLMWLVCALCIAGAYPAFVAFSASKKRDKIRADNEVLEAAIDKQRAVITSRDQVVGLLHSEACKHANEIWYHAFQPGGTHHLRRLNLSHMPLPPIKKRDPVVQDNTILYLRFHIGTRPGYCTPTAAGLALCDPADINDGLVKLHGENERTMASLVDARTRLEELMPHLEELEKIISRDVDRHAAFAPESRRRDRWTVQKHNEALAKYKESLTTTEDTRPAEGPWHTGYARPFDQIQLSPLMHIDQSLQFQYMEIPPNRVAPDNAYREFLSELSLEGPAGPRPKKQRKQILPNQLPRAAAPRRPSPVNVPRGSLFPEPTQPEQHQQGQQQNPAQGLLAPGCPPPQQLAVAELASRGLQPPPGGVAPFFDVTLSRKKAQFPMKAQSPKKGTRRFDGIHKNHRKKRSIRPTASGLLYGKPPLATLHMARALALKDAAEREAKARAANEQRANDPATIAGSIIPLLMGGSRPMIIDNDQRTVPEVEMGLDEPAPESQPTAMLPSTPMHGEVAASSGDSGVNSLTKKFETLSLPGNESSSPSDIEMESRPGSSPVVEQPAFGSSQVIEHTQPSYPEMIPQTPSSQSQEYFEPSEPHEFNEYQYQSQQAFFENLGQSQSAFFEDQMPDSFEPDDNGIGSETGAPTSPSEESISSLDSEELQRLPLRLSPSAAPEESSWPLDSEELQRSPSPEPMQTSPSPEPMQTSPPPLQHASSKGKGKAVDTTGGMPQRQDSSSNQGPAAIPSGRKIAKLRPRKDTSGITVPRPHLPAWVKLEETTPGYGPGAVTSEKKARSSDGAQSDDVGQAAAGPSEPRPTATARSMADHDEIPMADAEQLILDVDIKQYMNGMARVLGEAEEFLDDEELSREWLPAATEQMLAMLGERDAEAEAMLPEGWLTSKQIQLDLGMTWIDIVTGWSELDGVDRKQFRFSLMEAMEFHGLMLLE